MRRNGEGRIARNNIREWTKREKTKKVRNKKTVQYNKKTEMC
jgi:hypothetical protein